MSVFKISTIVLALYSFFCASISLGFLQTTLEPHMRQFKLSPAAMGKSFLSSLDPHCKTEGIRELRIVESAAFKVAPVLFLYLNAQIQFQDILH
jgi:hypothetical protein